MTPIITTMTSTGQIYLPKKARRALKITKASRIKVSLLKDKAIIEVAKESILDAAGMLAGSKPVRPVDIDNIRDYIDYSR
jgi:bifunctional DNA-binding transcriptional regulator/antitoxin component of YhaV-PrlF toxin-antitoxin module